MSENNAIDSLITDIHKLQNENGDMINIIRQFVAVWDIVCDTNDYKALEFDKTWNCYLQASNFLKRKNNELQKM